MYYSLSFPRGDRRRRRRREQEEQVGHDVGALEHVPADALDRSDDRRRGEGLCRSKFRAPHAIDAMLISTQAKASAAWIDCNLVASPSLCLTGSRAAVLEKPRQ